MSTWTVHGVAEGWTVPGFTEQRELGHGASGRVAAAVHDRSGRRVAVKYLSPALVGDSVFMRRFRAEAPALVKQGVPHGVRVYDFIEEPGQGAAVIMELVDGVSMRQMIERQGPTGPEAALTVFKRVLLALAAAHRLGIGHRDCKPENVLVDADGNSKLGDFGVAVRPGAQSPAAGSPLYLAPERWRGAPASPATDLYAATGVFFECLTGRPPFTGTLEQLAEQHLSARVPLDLVDPELEALVAHGMAKDPARRPHSAMAFAAELEALAAAAYGPGWEDQGRRQMAERVAAMRPPADRGWAKPSSGSPGSSTPPGGGSRGLIAIATVAAAAVIVLGGVAAAVTLKHKAPGHPAASTSGTSSQAMPVAPAFTAVADVTPPVAVSKCAAPTTFAYSGTLSASEPGTVKYEWVYSSGNPGPVQSVSFTSAGRKTVTGMTVTSKTAGGGWGEIKLISPAGHSSSEAAYKLFCGTGSAGGITATATVTPSSRTVDCATAPPPFTIAGSIKSAKAETVTYYWARSDGANSVPATLTFTGPGTKAVQTLTFTPPAASGSGQAVLVVTSPVTSASAPTTYTLTCNAPASPATTNPTAPPTTVPAAPSTAQASSGPSSPSATVTVSDSSSPSQAATGTHQGSGQSATLTLNANLSQTATIGQPYSGTVTATGGDGTYSWSEAGLPSELTGTPNGATFTISGTPAPPIETVIIVDIRVTDGESPAQTRTYELAMSVSWPPITLTSNMPLTATVGQPYSGTVTASGGDGSAFNFHIGVLPGLQATVNGATVTISGTPTSVNPDKNGNFGQMSVLVTEDFLNAGQSFPVVVSAAS